MKRSLKPLQIVFLCFLFVYSCSRNQPAQSFKSDYLGQFLPTNDPVIFAPGLVSLKGRFEMGLSMSPDGKSIAYGTAHESDPAQTNIHLLYFEKGKWEQLDPSAFPDNQNVFFPMFSPGGNKLYFSKYLDGKDNDLWMADYKNGHITNPQPLDSIINSTSREAGHGLLKDGTLYFTSNRDDIRACCGDIYRSSLDGQQYKTVERVGDLNSDFDEESLFLSPNGDYIITQSWKAEYESKHDLYISYLMKNNQWTQPKRLPAVINGPEIEQRPYVSPDGKFLFFSRMSIEQNDAQVLYESDIYWVSTDQVFTPYVFDPVNSFEVNQERFEIKLPENLFLDINDVSLEYQISLPNGDLLPAWIQFDESDFSLIGNWQTDKTLVLRLTAINDHGQSVSTDLELRYSR